MDTNEIMVNEEVVEVTEEIVNASSGKGLKMAAGIGLAVLGSAIAYKYVVKPLIAKIKAKADKQESNEETCGIEDAEIVEESVETQ